MVLVMPVKWKKRGVIFVCHRRALLKINRENGHAPLFMPLWFFAAGKREQLDELPAILPAEIFAGQQRIKKIVLARFNGGVGVAGNGPTASVRWPESSVSGNSSNSGPAWKLFSAKPTDETFSTKIELMQRHRMIFSGPLSMACFNVKFIRYRYLLIGLTGFAVLMLNFNIDVDFLYIFFILCELEVFTSVPPDPVPATFCRHRVFLSKDVCGQGNSARPAKMSAPQSCTSQCRLPSHNPGCGCRDVWR